MATEKEREKGGKSVLEDKDKFGRSDAERRLDHMGDKPGTHGQAHRPEEEKKKER